MTLTEFLTARFDEDEATARKAQRAYQHVLGIPHYFTANADTSVAMNPRVALAEVEAKRRIVDHCDIISRIEGFRGDDARAIAAWMSLPYADHPDFDPQWVNA